MVNSQHLLKGHSSIQQSHQLFEVFARVQDNQQRFKISGLLRLQFIGMIGKRGGNVRRGGVGFKVVEGRWKERDVGCHFVL